MVEEEGGGEKFRSLSESVQSLERRVYLELGEAADFSFEDGKNQHGHLLCIQYLFT